MKTQAVLARSASVPNLACLLGGLREAERERDFERDLERELERDLFLERFLRGEGDREVFRGEGEREPERRPPLSESLLPSDASLKSSITPAKTNAPDLTSRISNKKV